MIEALGLSKHYGRQTAVEDLNFEVRPGVVTGFLGPNGSGKSTTMRMILGLDKPTSGSVTIHGQRYRDLRNPARTVGALLDAKAMHGGRSARAHLRCLARLAGIPSRRVDEVLAMVGIQDAARNRTKKFSLGMSQRLGIATALLGDPKVLLLDEPVNGLDPEGILWIRNLMKGLAAEGRTVFVSSHLMSEMALTADHLIVIGRGRLLADMSVQAFIQQYSAGHVRVRLQPLEVPRLVQVLAQAGGRAQPQPDGTLQVTGIEAQRISELAHNSGLRLLELAPQQASLEEAYMLMTQGATEYRGTADPHAGFQPAAHVGAPPVQYAAAAPSYGYGGAQPPPQPPQYGAPQQPYGYGGLPQQQAAEQPSPYGESGA